MRAMERAALSCGGRGNDLGRKKRRGQSLESSLRAAGPTEIGFLEPRFLGAAAIYGENVAAGNDADEFVRQAQQTTGRRPMLWLVR